MYEIYENEINKQQQQLIDINNNNYYDNKNKSQKLKTNVFLFFLAV